ncbi:hypothetical protein, partial [Salmonella enterica]|uniref:hypothetical protein n=1 Tax=Salmonella enterica TaxID=28901 RepID=UPI003CE75F82
MVAGGILTHTAAVLLLFVLATAGVAGGRIGAGRGTIGIRAVLVALVAAAIVGYVLLVVPTAEALAHADAAVPPLFAI